MSILASTSRVQLAYVKEVVFGVIPAGSTGRFLRMTGESLDYKFNKVAAKEIRPDRALSGATSVDADVNGGFNFHMQYAEYDQFVEGAIQNVYTVYGVNGVGAVFVGTHTSTTITATVAPTGNSAFTLLQGGQWFRYLAPTDANNGKLFRVSTSVAPSATVITLDASTPATVSASIANCAVQSSRTNNGTTQMSFVLEKNSTDIGQFLTYVGMNVNKMTINLVTAAITDCVFDFIGQKATRQATTLLPGATLLSNVYEVQNAVRGISQLWENGVPLTGTYIKSMTVNLDNQLRGQKAIGNFGTVSVAVGDSMTTGKLEVYFANGVLYDKFLQDVYTSLIVSTQDGAGNGYIYSMPHVLLMNAKIVAGAKSQDMMVSFDYTAYNDDANATVALKKQLFIDRVGAAVIQTL